MANELIVNIVDFASTMSYADVGKHLLDEFEIPKSTIWKTISESLLGALFQDQVKLAGKKSIFS